MPEISIVTPCFNGAPYVGSAIESVINQQDAPSWEMVVVDDASDDASAEVVASFAARDPRVRLLRLARNSGVAAARNAALELSEGRYIAFLDSDDCWLPDKLRVQHALMQSNSWDMSYTAYRRVSAQTGRISSLLPVPATLSYRDLLGNPAMATSTIMVTRSLLGTRRFAVGTNYEDFALWLELLRNETVVAHGVQDDLMRYCVVPNSVSSKMGRSAKWVWRIYREHEGLSLAAAVPPFVSYAARAALKRLR